MTRSWVALGISALIAAPAPLYAHGGGLDANGCHHDRINGGYHCHSGSGGGGGGTGPDISPVVTVVIVSVVVAAIATWVGLTIWSGRRKRDRTADFDQMARVGRVVQTPKRWDDVRVAVDGEVWRLRLPGIDCPRSSKDAVAHMLGSLAPEGEEVRLVPALKTSFDVLEPHVLAYMDLADGRDVGQQLIKRGHCSASRDPHLRLETYEDIGWR